MGSATVFFSSRVISFRDVVKGILFSFFVPMIIGAIFVAGTPSAHAAVTVAGPPIDPLFQDATVVGGAYVPLVQFRLSQSSGSATLNSVAVAVTSTTTIYNLNAGSANGEINNLFFYRESGTHFGFQPSEDILLNTGLNAVTDPATTSPITITVDPAQRAVGTSPTDYYVVARATTSAVLVTGHAVYATTTANWITTSGGAIGTAFTGMRKATFQRNVSNIKISEVKQGGTGNAGDEFIELYNTGDLPIDLSRMPLNLFIYNINGGIATKTITYINRVIPPRGYFLITSATNYGGNTPADATYPTGPSDPDLIADGGLSISTTTTATGARVATTSAIDLIAWGNQPLANAASSTMPNLAPPTALANLVADKSYERKATTTSDATSMATGGFDATNGNGRDTSFNNNDFALQPPAGVNPQNSFSPQEFTFSAAGGGGGGGGGSEQKLQVAGSFPGPNQMSVPVDISFIGFNFSKNAATGTIISAGATTTVTLTGGGPNLCASVTYNPFPGNFEPQAKCVLAPGSGGVTLSQSTTYTFTVSTDVRDQSGVQLDQDPFTNGNQSYSITFTTGAAGIMQTNTTPPMVIGATPFPGSANIPTNLAKILIKFNTANMSVSTLTNNNIILSSSGGNVVLSSPSFNASTSILSLVPASLAANTQYTLSVGVGVSTSNGIHLFAPYTTTFTTGANADGSAPVVIGVFPTASSTALALNAVDFVFITDDYLDPSTATSGAVTLSFGGSNLPGTVSYDPVAKEGHFTATNPLPAGASGNLVLTLATGTLRNISNVQIGYQAFNYSTEASNSDSIAPAPLFANADVFGIAVTFSEAVKATDATNLANYEVAFGGATTTLSALAGHTIAYDATKRTAQISGLFLQPGSAFRVIVSNIKDISGNAMTVSSSVTGTVLSVAQSGGSLGPGGGTGGGSFGPQITDFSSFGIGFAPGLQVMPMNQFISASTTYGFMIPISKQIPVSGTIVITFPSSSDFSLCCAKKESANNPQITTQNADINGPGTGTVAIASVAKDTTAKTITITTGTAPTRSENSDTHDILNFSLVDIKNPSVPKGVDSSGYLLDIKTKDASGNLLESFTSNPIYISGGAIGGSATTTVRGNVSGNGGNLENVTIRLMAPQIGTLETTTDASGNYSFANLPINNQISSFGTSMSYAVFTDPIITGVKVGGSASTTGFFGEPMPTPVNATSTSLITRNFALIATTSALNFAVKLTANNSADAIFTVGEQIQIFANGPGRFIVQTFTTATTDYSGTTIVTIPIPQVNGSWGVGMGPAMPIGMGGASFGPPPAPKWVMPKPVEVVVSGCEKIPAACVATVGGITTTSNTFTVSTANRTITGILKDASGNIMSGVGVFAFSPSQGFGANAQTSLAGVFIMKVGDGSFNVGAFVPGMESSRTVPVVVNSTGVFVDGSATASTGSSGANPFVLTMKKPGYTITGRVTDGTNAVSNASVFAYRTDGPGNANSQTDSSGNFTLYVDNGAWKVNAFIPGFGPMPEQNVTVSGASQSNINFSPSTSLTYRTLSGIVFESSDANIATSTEGVSGVIVRVSGANGTNETITGSDGTFTLRVPSGTYTFADIFKPGYGRIAPLDHNLAAITSLTLTADLYKPIRVQPRQTVTVTVKDNTGAAITVSHAFIDLLDINTGFGTHGEIINGTSTTIQVPNGASTTVRAFIDGVPPQNLSVATDDVATTLVLSGVLQVNGAEAVKVVLNSTASAMVDISGKVYAGSIGSGNELADAWVQFVDPTKNIRFGAQATSSGIFVVRAATSTYQVIAFKPGYLGTASTVTLTAGTASLNLVMTAAGSSISGTVTSSGSGVANAFVWAERVGGTGFSSTKTNASGTYTLTVDSGQWKVYAATDGAQKTAYTGNPVSAGATGITIPLAISTSLITKLSTSNTFTDTSAGSFSDSTVGVKVGLDSGALGSAGSSAYLSAKKTTNVPVSSDTNVLGDAGWDISAVNGSSVVTNLQTGKTAEVTLNMTKADLAAEGIDTTTEVAAVTVASWSDDKKTWESLSTVATYKDASGNAVTSTSNLSNVTSVDFTTSSASHFSPYALSFPTNGSAPATPTGLAVSQTSGAVTASLTWTANTENDLSGYFVYRDTSSSGSFPLRATLGAVASYTDNADAGTTYYYKISAFNTANHESAATAAVSVAIANASGASTPASSGGGGSPSIGQVTPAPTPAPTPAVSTVTKSTQTPVGATATAPSGPANALSRVTNPSLYPQGIVNGNFGPATLRAVKKFQQKYGITQNGRVGPLTRAKLQEVFGAQTAVTTTPAPSPTPASGSMTTGGSASVFVQDLAIGSLALSTRYRERQFRSGNAARRKEIPAKVRHHPERPRRPAHPGKTAGSIQWDSNSLTH
ncbi:MAG: carboxypeptidase regulatory-like domain-containing protein [Candidatus Sungbacteria bacterium]|nr:carboxypeptidase regulatory-like domain-containing protein [Candidatus Sungbacteria bacterium]